MKAYCFTKNLIQNTWSRSDVKSNKEILAAVKLLLNTETEYRLIVDYDLKGNPIIKVAPVVKVIKDNVSEKIRTLFP